MQAIAATSGGRMTVEKQSFVQPVTLPRIPTPTVITNVIATLRGTTSPNRIYVVTGHYDSRITDVNNFTDDAPGADDDGSGVAAYRAGATLRHDADGGDDRPGRRGGEEQGLFGSAFMAAQMKAAGADIQGAFSNDIIGASSAFDGTPRDPHTLRLFVEGVPTTETAQQAATRRAVGGENDGRRVSWGASSCPWRTTPPRR